MINDQDFKVFNYNILGAESKFTGDLILTGDTVINSFIEGNIEMRGPGKLVLERGSIVKGKIKAQDMELFGSVEGEVECTGLLSIRSSAYLQGQVKSARLVIYPGAVVEMNASSQE